MYLYVVYILVYVLMYIVMYVINVCNNVLLCYNVYNNVCYNMSYFAKVTRAHVVPPIVLALAKHPVIDKFDLSSCKGFMSGAAPLGAEIQKVCNSSYLCKYLMLVIIVACKL